MARLGVGIDLVGRRAELTALEETLRRAGAGRAGAVLVSGDAGVGKSRLMAEASAAAVTAGFTVLTGRCLDAAESALPYLPFTEVVSAAVARRPELASHHPALAVLQTGGFLATDGDRAHDLAGRGTSLREFDQLRVFDGVLSALGELAAIAPVLVVLEDLHWADRSSRDLLVFLLSRLADQRLAVLTTHRGDDLHRRHPLRAVLTELVRLPAVERLDLLPLGRDESLELVRRLAEGALPDEQLRVAARRSEGNAFYAEELVSAGPSRTLPQDLAEVLLARVEALSSRTQGVLRAAAVAGDRIRHDRLAAVSALDVDDLEQALREAVGHHVLVAVDGGGPGAPDTYAFRHALLREAVYHGLLPGERSRVHAAYAALLAPSLDSAANVAPGLAAELAHHAMAGHDLPLALAASVRAARDADDRAAPAEMLLHSERAIELWPAVPDAEEVAGLPEAVLTRWASWGASATGDHDRGAALAARALELAEQRGDPELIASVAFRYAMRLFELAARDDTELVVARRAVDVLADRPPSADLAWAHAILARAHVRRDHFDDAVAEGEAAIAAAAAVGPDDLHAAGATAAALVELAVCAEHGGDAERGRRLLAEARPLARRSQHLEVELRSYYNEGLSLLDAGRLEKAARVFAAGEDRAAEAGITWSGQGLNLRVVHVVTRFVLGQWASAAAATEIAGRRFSATVVSRLTAAGLLSAAASGRSDLVERGLAELAHIDDVLDEQAILFAGRAAAEDALWRGDPAAAARLLDSALAGIGRSAPAYGPHLGSIMLGALGLAAQADLRRADGGEPRTAEVERLHALVHDIAVRGVPRAGVLGPEGRGWVAWADAERGRACGDADPAAWSAVIEAFAFEAPEPDRLGRCGYQQAWAHLRRAEALLDSGAAHGSTQPDLAAALNAATALGAAPLEAAVRALARRAGVAVGQQAPRSDTAALLTPREHSVLALVAGGRTNRQVGSELYISEKTVSVHLSRVMAKLGAASRTEAVGLAYDRGLLTPAAEPAPQP